MSTEQGSFLSERVNAELLNRPEKVLSGNSALITGATRMNGIGFAIAERFALEGASPIIIVGTERSQDIAQFATSRLKRYGVDAYNFVGDVTDEKSCTKMMMDAYDLSDGNVNILVNNAGTNRNMALTDTTLSDWHSIADPKEIGSFLMTREWFRIRNETGVRGGRVINIGSVIGIWGQYGQVPYEMANGALIGMTKGLALDLSRRGITVNLIAPYFVEGTDMTANMTDQMDAIKAVAPLGELIKASDVAGAAAFFAGPDAQKINGTILPVDCGAQSNYTAIYGLHRAGYRRVPRVALGIIGDISAGEVKLVQDYRKKQTEEGTT